MSWAAKLRRFIILSWMFVDLAAYDTSLVRKYAACWDSFATRRNTSRFFATFHTL